jgi:hypothetical protein
MLPSDALALIAGITGLAYAVDRMLRRRSPRALRRLATDCRMTFGRFDTLKLTPKVARHFPIPGAANLRVTDVIYGVEKERYRYVFTADYTIGVVRAKRRQVRVCRFSEPRDRDRTDAPTPVVLAPAELSIIEQYRYLVAPTEHRTR